jgi:hypothetical protein
MAPENYCPAHSELMRALGALEEGQAHLCKETSEIKRLLEEKGKAEKGEVREQAEEKTRSKILYWGIGTAFVALISAATHYLIGKLCG